MLERIIAGSIRNRLLVIIGTLALIFAGARAFDRLPIDAIPDLTNVQVMILTTAPALGPLDVERFVTAPVELATSGLPNVEEIRSLSRYGVSAVTVVFNDEIDTNRARQLVNERMPRIRAQVPPQYGIPEMGPPTSGLGEIYQFEVRAENLSLMDRRSVLEWQIAPRLRLVPGIVEVNTFGGELKTYEVAVDPERMVASQISLSDIFTALDHNNRSSGGGAILRGPEGVLVRADGLIQSLEDIRQIVVATRNDVPITIAQVADVRFAPMLRQGAATRDGRGEIVSGVAMMLQGENSRSVTAAVEEAVREINRSLPRGVRIDTFYNRTELVNKTLNTVTKNLLEGGALVIIMLVLMLRNLRAGVVAAATIPLAMLGAVLGMRLMGVSGNLMSLGAIDFGLIVDGAIILLENAVHHVSEERARLGRALTFKERDDVVLHSALEVRSATAFGETIIALVYLPILTLQGVEGKMFKPMAWTVLFALITAFVLSITFVPALASVALSRTTHDRPSPIVEWVRRVYQPALDWVIRRPIPTTCVAALVLVVAALVSTGLGSEFAPTLDEGTIVLETNRLPSTSLEESVGQGRAIENTLRRFPQVATVVTKSGRAEIANDPMGVEQSDVYVMLKPRSMWPENIDREVLMERMSDAMKNAVPGTAFGFSQPIEMRMNELVSGVRSAFAVKIYGDDFEQLSHLSAQVVRVLRQVPGAADVRAGLVDGLPVLKATIDRAALARRNATATDVLDAIEIVGGRTVGEVLEGRRRYPLRVRLLPTARDSMDSIRMLPIRTGDGSFAPLADLAQVEIVDEPLLIDRESTERRLIVQANVRGRDLGSFAAEAQARIEQSVRRPHGYHIEYGGEFENLRRARARLLIVVPIALLVIVLLLFLSFRAVRPVALILLAVPFAATGGVLALALRGFPFSISAAVGFIALFGVSVLNGLVLITQIRQFEDEGRPAAEAAREGALRRLRPVLTTALVASLGFLPMAFATGSGAEVQKPLATVVIGGILTSTLLTLLVLPALAARFGHRKVRTAE